MKKFLAILFLFLTLFLAGCQKKEKILEDLPDFNDSEQEKANIGKDLQIAQLDLEGGQKKGIKVLSGSFFPVNSQDGKTIVGARLIGEIENTDDEKVENISSVVKFFDKEDREAGIKIGEFFPGFEFLPIEPGKAGLYDLFIAEAPVSEKAQVLMEPKKPKEDRKRIALEIVSRQVEEKEQEVGQQQGQEVLGSTEATVQPAKKVKYFSCNGSFVNNQETAVKNMVVLVWIKNKKGEVFGYGVKKFSQDLLLPGKNKEFEINFALFIEDKMASFEIRVFGEEYR